MIIKPLVKNYRLIDLQNKIDLYIYIYIYIYKSINT